MNGSSPNRLPLSIICIGGLTGVAVDFFDGIALLGGPEWLHQLDLLTAIVLCLVFGSIGAYRLRRD
jgi:hypothetical protein